MFGFLKERKESKFMVWELSFFFLTVESFIQNELLGTNPIYISLFIQSKHIYCVPSIVQSTIDIAMNTKDIKPQTSWNFNLEVL